MREDQTKAVWKPPPTDMLEASNVVNNGFWLSLTAGICSAHRCL